jgi:oxygen-independent coproporphyrinogen-3 oxidase
MGEYHTVLAAGAGAVTKLVSKDTNMVERIFSPKYPYEFLDDSKYSGFDLKTVSDFYTRKF